MFRGAKSTAPLPQEFAKWTDFFALLAEHEFKETEKLNLPAFMPGELLPRMQRADDNVKHLVCFTLDVDGPDSQGVTEEVALDTLAKLHELGLMGVFYTTYSHHKVRPNWKFRLVVPLSRPVLASEWSAFWPKANALFDNVGDPKCKNPSRIYFGAYAPKGTEDSAVAEVFEGKPLDVDALIGAAPPPEATAEKSKGEKKEKTKAGPVGTKTLTRSLLTELVKKLRRKKAPYYLDMGTRLKQVLDGEAYAEPGERDDITFKLASILAQELPSYSPTSIASFFVASLQLMELQSKGAPTLKIVADKIERHQRSKSEEKAEREEKEGEERTAIIREAFNNGRDTPYTPKEVAGLNPRHWIIQKDKGYYIWFDGAYRGPYTPTEVFSAAHRDLSPAWKVGVALHKLDNKGAIVPKSVSDLMLDYGTVADKVIVDLSAQKCVFNASARIIIEAPCPLRDLEPRFDENIAKWFWLLSGKDKVAHEKLKTWFATSMMLEKACAALMLTGEASVGKTLSALGTARLFTIYQPTSLSAVFGNFNDAIMQCPIILADEHLPKDWRGQVKSAELRRHLQETRRELHRKFLPTASLMGATRTIIASNSDDILATNERQSKAEMDASLLRYFLLKVSLEARDFLKATDTSGWVNDDLIARHILWLRDNHPWQEEYEQNRFIIDVGVDSLRSEALIHNAAQAVLNQWIVGFLRDQAKISSAGPYALMARVHKGRILINVQAPLNHWKNYVPNERCPTVGYLGTVLKDISHDERVMLWVGKVAVNYREVRLEEFLNWSDQSGLATREEIIEILSHDTEIHT